MTPSELRPATPDGGVSRRSLLTRSASASVGIVLTGSIPGFFGTAHAKHGGEVGYGPLIPDPDGLLSLPEGFSYKLVAKSGETLLETGQPTPDDPDGTAAFVRRGGNGSVLVQNHEIGGSESFRVPALEGLTYDPLAGGGTTNIEVDKDGNRVREYVSLAGTHNNCAGGTTPWDTWITCEETEGAPSGSTVRHGYCFEVDPYDQDKNLDPKPIKALGRFAHESRRRRPAHARHLPHRGREQPERAPLPLDAARGRAAARRRVAAGARRRRRHARGAAGDEERRVRPRPLGVQRAGHAAEAHVGRGARPRRDDALDAQAGLRAAGHAQPQARGHVVGRRRRVLRRVVRP